MNGIGNTTWETQPGASRRPRRTRRGIGCLIGGLALLTSILASPTTSLAVPVAPGQKVELGQPSGATVAAKPFGDEWYHGFETRQGYTVLKDRQSDVWEYAEHRGDGLAPGGAPANRPAPDSVEPHLRDEGRIDRAEHLAAEEPPVEDSAAAASGDGSAEESPSPANTGTQHSLVILVQFADQDSLGTSPSQWRDRFFGATDSVSDYYDEVSYGKLKIAPAADSFGANDGVVGWVTLNRNHPRADGSERQATVRDAVIAANPYVNYASYDRDGDGRVSADELHITVIPAGWEESSCVNVSGATPAVWGHHWVTGDYTPAVDGVWAASEYTMFGEMHCGGGAHMATLGIMAHEMGHDLDMPDLYDIDGSSSGGVGEWSVMGNGSWLAAPGRYAGSDPAHPDAFLKYYQGWTDPLPAGNGRSSLGQTETTPAAIRMLDNPGSVDWTFGERSGSGEYFLVENRQRVGYDRALPGCGMLIWHVDETRTSGNSANATETRRLVDLEEADGDPDVAGSRWEGPFDSTDAWLGGSFDGGSTPSSRLYDGSASGISVSGFDRSCASTMSASFSDGGSSPGPVNDQFGAAQPLAGTDVSRNDANVGASKEQGEPRHAGNEGGASVWYRWTAPGSGTVAIDTRGSDFDTVLAAYTGSSLATLHEVASDDDIVDGQDQDSEISFSANAGTTYRIAVDGFNDEGAGPATGSLVLHLSQASAPAAAPDTYFTQRPPHVIRKRSATFAFGSNAQGASFECRYSTGWRSCSSPVTFRHLSARRYAFKVRAVADGEVDATPASWSFRVRPRR